MVNFGWAVFDQEGQMWTGVVDPETEDDARNQFLESNLLPRGDGTGHSCTGRDWADAVQLGYRSTRVCMNEIYSSKWVNTWPERPGLYWVRHPLMGDNAVLARRPHSGDHLYTPDCETRIEVYENMEFWGPVVEPPL